AARVRPIESTGWRERVRPSATTDRASAVAIRPRSAATTERSTSNMRSSRTAAVEFVRSLRTLPRSLAGMVLGDFGGRLKLPLAGAAPWFFAVDRQENRDTCPFTDATVDLDRTGVQRDQSLHDRQSEAGAVVGSRVRGTRLEERIADPRQ